MDQCVNIKRARAHHHCIAITITHIWEMGRQKTTTTKKKEKQRRGAPTPFSEATAINCALELFGCVPVLRAFFRDDPDALAGIVSTLS